MLDLWFAVVRWIRRPWPIALLFIGVALVDPLGLRSASDRASQDIVLRFLAPFYESDRQPITVVLFDDASLRALDQHWPPEYSVTVNLLRQVLCAEPRAVFVDLLFAHQHEPDNPQAFENLVQHLAGGRGCRSDTPIYVADMADQPGFPVPGNSVVLERLRRQQEGQTKPVQRVPANWVAEPGIYPLVLEDVDPTGWLSPPAALPAGLPTPAFALYRTAMPGADPADFIAPMVVRWGFTPQDEPSGSPDLGGHCESVDGDDWALRIAVQQFGMDLLRIFDRPHRPRQACPYSFFVSAHTAIKGGSSRQGGPLHELFHDRYVLIGAFLAGAGDVTVSPVHGQLPGVFGHGMALDNLFRYHAGYWRPMPPLGRGWPAAQISWGAVLSIALFLILQRLNLHLFRPWRAELRRDRPERAPMLAALEVLLGLAIIGVAIMGLALLHYSPINWLGLIALWLTAAQTVSSELAAISPEPAARPAAAHRAAAADPNLHAGVQQ